MKDPTYHLYLESQEREVAIHSLVELKNQLITGVTKSRKRFKMGTENE